MFQFDFNGLWKGKIMSGHPFETDLDKNSANYIPLTPLSFIGRCARTFPTRPSVIYGDKVFTWEETYQRCLNLASALKKRGIGIGDLSLIHI